MRARLIMLLGSLAVASLAWGNEVEENAAASVRYYRVVDGKVDSLTYTGWRIYHSSCYSCHGVDAAGTSIAPSLVDRVKHLTARQFAVKVMTRYHIVIPGESIGADDQSAARAAILEEVMKHERGAHGALLMPAWERDPRVQPHILDLYGYLKARADGVLAPGKPKLIE